MFIFPRPDPTGDQQRRDRELADAFTPKSEPIRPPDDTQAQLSDLFAQVYDSERRERMNDRIDQAIRIDEVRGRSKRRRKSKSDG